MTFDWTTFALQLVNVLVLLAILHRLLFRRVAAIIAERRARTAAELDAARKARAEAEADSARARAEAEATAADRRGLLDKAQAEAAEQRAKLLEAARTEAARIIADGQAALTRQQAASAQHVLSIALDLASSIAARALAAQPPTVAGYLDRLDQALAAMAPGPRAALLGAGDLRLVLAGPLTAADRQAALDLLHRHGAAPEITTDPALIAGVELTSASGSLRNSLRHDLESIAKAMTLERSPL